ncbi:hypothetical protein [Streptomyces klenkii]|uniref:hypothetical protein n=1 Tax=Streptomyces klenkii TaxID=1420899 RepID=UPI0034417063
MTTLALTPPAENGLVQVITIGACMAMAVIGMAVLAVRGFREWRNQGRPALLVLLAGSLVAYLTLPGLDLYAGFRFSPPTSFSPNVIRLFGLDEPLWTLTFCPLYIALPAYLAYTAFAQGWTLARLWRVLFLLTAVDLAIELPAVNLTRVYTYRGDQPLELLNVPLIWPMAYFIAPMYLGAIVHHLSSYLHGARWLLVVPLAGSGYLAFLPMIAWPGVIAVHDGSTHPVGRTLLGLAAIAVELAAFHLLALRLKPGVPGSPADVGNSAQHLRQGPLSAL